MKRIGILGAGTWGMALARMLTVSGNDVLVSFTTRAEVRLWGLVDGRRSWLRDVDTIRLALPLLRVQEENVPPGE